MSLNQSYISVLDIGSSKICCMIAEKDANDFNKIIGIGHIESQGIKAGVVTDFSLAIKSVSKAINAAEKKANIKIKNGITVSISSDKTIVKSFKSKVDINEKKVSRNHINESFELVMKDIFFSDKKIIHITPINFILDDVNEIQNPEGMYASKLEIEFIVTYIGKSHYKNYIACITQCDVDINRIISSSLAVGSAVLNEQELDLGSIIVDMGANTTSLAIFSKNNLVFSKTLAFGGYEITEALARRFSVTFEEAEKLKVMHASVIESSEADEVFLEIPSINFQNNENYVQITKREVYETIAPLIIKTLEWIKIILKNSGYGDLTGRVIVYTGGASQIDGLAVLTRDYLNYNSRVGVARDIKFNFHNVYDSSYSVSAGLIQHAVYENRIHGKLNEFRNSKRKNKVNFSFIKNWVGENFF